MKSKFRVSEWWRDATASLFGTIVGITLTVGITYWQQKIDNADMTRKITKITLHNIDTRIDNLESYIEYFKEKDSIFQQLNSYIPDRLGQLEKDSLLQILNILTFQNIILTDTKSENIFSHSFEVWQYLDDEKIIGRISNCYSIIEFVEESFKKWDEELAAILHRYMVTNIEKGNQWQTEEMVNFFVGDSEIIILFNNIHNNLHTFTPLIDITKQLNDRNKDNLGLSDEELEELGNLL